MAASSDSSPARWAANSTHPDGLHRGQDRIQPARRQRLHLVQRPLFDHGRDPRVAVGVEQGAVGFDHDPVIGPGFQQRAGRGLPVRQRPVRRPRHRPGPGEPLPVAGRDGRRRRRIEGRQPEPERRLALGVVKRAGLFARRDRDRRNLGQPLGKGGEIQARAADDQRRPLLRAQFVQQRQDGPRPAPDRPGVSGVRHPIEPVLGLGLFLDRGPGAEHAQIRVELLAVGVEDDRMALRGQRQRQPRLARGGRPGDQGYQGS
jgi:hypothetical protein